MAYLRTSEAAALLNVTASTLRTWERRFDYPRPQRTPGRHRQYSESEILSLRDALQDGLSISSAISRARQSLGADGGTLAGALTAFDGARADATLETALELRSVERAVEDLLLPTLSTLAKRHGEDSATHAFALRWAADWLRRARRVMSMGVPHLSLLVGDASGGESDPDAPSIRALELFAARAGMRVVSVPVDHPRGLSAAVAAVEPDALVVAGRRADLDTIARWVFGARGSGTRLPVALFRTVVEPVQLDRRRVRPLSLKPSAALEELMAAMSETEEPLTVLAHAAPVEQGEGGQARASAVAGRRR